MPPCELTRRTSARNAPERPDLVSTRSVCRARPSDDLPAAPAGDARRGVDARRVRGHRGARTHRAHPASARQGRVRVAAVRAERRDRHRPQARLGPPAAAEEGQPRHVRGRRCHRRRGHHTAGRCRRGAEAPADRQGRHRGRHRRQRGGARRHPPHGHGAEAAAGGGRERRGRHEEGPHRLRVAHVVQRPPAGGPAGRTAGAGGGARRGLRGGAVRRPGHRDDRGLPDVLRVGRRPDRGHGAHRARRGPRAHHHPDPARQARGDVLRAPARRRRRLRASGTPKPGWPRAFRCTARARSPKATRSPRRARPRSGSRPRCTTPTSSPRRRTPPSSPPTRPPTRRRRAASRCRATTRPRYCTRRSATS